MLFQDFLGGLFLATGKGVPPDRLQEYASSIVSHQFVMFCIIHKIVPSSYSILKSTFVLTLAAYQHPRSAPGS